MIFRQATHYLRDEPGNPPGRTATIEFLYNGNSTGAGSTNHDSSSRAPKGAANFKRLFGGCKAEQLLLGAAMERDGFMALEKQCAQGSLSEKYSVASGTVSVSDLNIDQQAFWPMLMSLTLPVPSLSSLLTASRAHLFLKEL